MIITVSHMGYIKRTPLSEFRAQGRGGVGAKGSETRDEDFVEYIYPHPCTRPYYSSRQKVNVIG